MQTIISLEQPIIVDAFAFDKALGAYKKQSRYRRFNKSALRTALAVYHTILEKDASIIKDKKPIDVEHCAQVEQAYLDIETNKKMAPNAFGIIQAMRAYQKYAHLGWL